MDLGTCRGDTVRYTGTQRTIGGKVFYDAVYIEGHREGEDCCLPDPPGDTKTHAINQLLTIMAYYHKSVPGHEDSCENPENCGHCLAVKFAMQAIA